jgi:hypothetical protein
MRFFRKLAIFTLPFALGFLLLTGSLIYIGESIPLHLVIWMQDSDTPVLFRPMFGNRDQDFKLLSVNYRQPEIIVIGSSRVLQFRAQFANKNPRAFYNAAAPAWRLPEVSRMLFEMGAKPKVIVLGIDYPWFNDAYAGDPIVEPPTNFWSRMFVVNRTFLQDMILGENQEKLGDIPRLLARVEPGGSGGIALGGRAIIDGHGFRNDGSEQYGDFLVAGHIWQPNARGRDMGLFENGENMYIAGDTVSEYGMNQMREVLEFAAENDILVVGFFPPYMPSLWEQMSVSENHTYIQQAYEQVSALFEDYDFPLFDYSDATTLDATDEDFFDGWHASEKIAARLYLDLVANVPELQPYTDSPALQSIIDSADDSFRVFPFVSPQPQ